MMKNALLFLIFFVITLLFCDYKGWVEITPDGRKKALLMIDKGKDGVKKMIHAFNDTLKE